MCSSEGWTWGLCKRIVERVVLGKQRSLVVENIKRMEGEGDTPNDAKPSLMQEQIQ